MPVSWARIDGIFPFHGASHRETWTGIAHIRGEEAGAERHSRCPEFHLQENIVKHLTTLPAAGADITGAGSTFVYPVLAKWAEQYSKKAGVNLNYQSIGSGGGIKQITAKTVTFGASDMPLMPADIAKNNFVQFPVINGAVVPLLN